jgi:NitT/TauT family transport system substrate-binding protein
MRIRIAMACLLLVLAGTGSGTGTAKAQNIRFTLDWAFQGPTSAFLHANRAGYYRAEGLNVTVDAGQGSAGAIQRVASGAYQMGFADFNSAIEYNANNPGQPIRGVMVLYDRAPFSVITLRGRGITTAKDLEGKRLGAPQFDASFRLFPSFAAATGVDRSKVVIQNMAPPLRETMLQRGEVDFITGHFFTSFLELRARGVAEADIVVFRYADAGLPFYGNGVVASPQMISERGPQITSFLRATIKAMREIAADPRIGIAAVKATDPLVDEALELTRLQIALRENILTERVASYGLGDASEERLAASIAQVTAAFGLPRQIAPGDLFDGKFLPPAAERRIP